MKKLFALLGLCVFMSGCMSIGQFVAQPNLNNRIDDPSKARIYVIRVARYAHKLPLQVFQDGELIANTKGMCYLTWEKEPGPVTIMGKAKNESVLNLNLEAGKVYYIQQRVHASGLASANDMILRDEKTGRELLAKGKPLPVVIK